MTDLEISDMSAIEQDNKYVPHNTQAAGAEEEEEVVLGADDQENLLNAVEELQQENVRMSMAIDQLKPVEAEPNGRMNNQVKAM